MLLNRMSNPEMNPSSFHFLQTICKLDSSITGFISLNLDDLYG